MKNFISKHLPLLSFGILQIFFSAPGQTFLIALFVGPIFEEMGVSRTYFAGIYSAATLGAALLLNPAGRLIDRYFVHNIVKAVSLLMALGCWLLAAADNLVILFLAFFMLRLIGQGVFGLTASTLMVKQFKRNRGRALGLITLGFPFSEAVYPSLALFLLAALGWRMSYVILGISNLVLMLPIQLILLKRARIQHGQFLPGEEGINPQRLWGNPEAHKIRPQRDFRLNEVLGDPKFYLILAASCLPPMVVTGLFFHQQRLFEANGWALGVVASAFMVYAVCKSVSSVWIGGVIDKFGPYLPFVVMIVLLGTGTLLAASGGPVIWIYFYFILIGAALGFSSPISNVIYPYFYGAKYIGSIKGFVATFRNGLTALGPLPIALALDAGVSMQTVLSWIGAAVLLMSALPVMVWYLERRIPKFSTLGTKFYA